MIRELGGYRLVERIGSGGMSTVYRAYDAGGNPVALKLLHPALAEDPSSRDRLRREVQMMQRVCGPYVAQILDAETEQDEVFLVTELIEGPTLAADVQTSGAYFGTDLAQLGEELGEALAAIHSVGVLHRDLKPSNVMIGENGPVLIDFGIAQLGDDLRITRQGYVTHTPGYCDPRVLRGQSPDEDADWWAMAAVLAFAATGRPPFGAGAPAVVMNQVLHGEPDLTGLPQRLQTAFATALRAGTPGAAAGRASYETLLDEIFAVAAQGNNTAVTQPVAAATQQVAAVTQPVEAATQPIYLATQPVAAATQPLAASPEHYPQSYPVPTPASLVPGTYPQTVPAPVAESPLPYWAVPPPKFRVLRLLLGLVLIAVGTIQPAIAAGAAVGLALIAQIVGDTDAALRKLRIRRGGPASNDALRMVMRFPWALLKAVVWVALAAVVALAVAYLAGAVANILLPTALPGVSGVAVGAGMLTLWGLVPLGRGGADVILAELAPNRGYHLFWILITSVVILGVAVAAREIGTVNLTPLEAWPW
ncbi:MAG: protein kinase [Trueperella sp.]|nr:protein kinase [Trueperella sp.]